GYHAIAWSVGRSRFGCGQTACQETTENELFIVQYDAKITVLVQDAREKDFYAPLPCLGNVLRQGNNIRAGNTAV
ncbi:MAG: hypothetical protein ABSA26_14810, partial [Thermoguttaceae bacterium]